jgi:hypothetical protein
MEYSNWTEWLLAAMGAGGLGAVVNQLIKRASDITGLPAFTISSILSVGLAVVVVWLTGQFDARNMTVTSMAIFTASQFIFRFLLSKDRVVESVPLAD